MLTARSCYSFSPKVPTLAYVITDGGSSNRDLTAQAANELHSSGVTVFAVGVSGAHKKELRLIASEEQYVCYCENFEQLSVIQKTFEQHTHRG